VARRGNLRNGGRRGLAWGATAAALLLGGCALTPVLVTREGGGQQAETAMSVNRFGIFTGVVTVTYNDATDQPPVKYTTTTRETRKGASHLGWSYSVDYGKTWTYGGRLTPSDAWPILWGDPAITHSVRDQRNVYIASLAVPKAKLDLAPQGKIDGGLENYIGGACIARSTDGGRTFSLYQCLQSTDADATGDFFDGGHMASDAAGNLYAAWANIDRRTVQVWRAVGENGTFQRLSPDPFGGQMMAGHPRLRVNLETGELFVMATNLSGELLIDRWNGSGWSPPWHTGMYAQGVVCMPGPSCNGAIALRAHPQFSFDIGAFGASNDHIRMMFTRRAASGRTYIAGAGCMLADQACFYIPQWGTGEADASRAYSSLNPLIRAYRSSAMAAAGEPSLWMGSHSTFNEATGRMSFVMGGVGFLQGQNNQQFFLYLPIYQLKDRVLCADQRGYWGDYDDLQAIGPVPPRESILFGRTFSVSEPACSYRWTFTSAPLRVGYSGN
jgi:hypothetical protein